MANEYNFQYELVQYKWPRWLHQQTEKQRIIWGYKILFLDVLFPLVVDKFLFVDADQVALKGQVLTVCIKSNKLLLFKCYFFPVMEKDMLILHLENMEICITQM